MNLKRDLLNLEENRKERLEKDRVLNKELGKDGGAGIVTDTETATTVKEEEKVKIEEVLYSFE